MRLLPAPTSVRPHRLVLGGLALLACVGLTTAASAQWETSVPVVLAGSVDNEWTNQFSLALDAESRPHAVWNTLTGAYYSHEDAGVWSTPVEIGADDAIYSVQAIAIAPGTSDPVVLVSRRPVGQPTGDLNLAEWNGSGFDLVPLTDDGLAEYTPTLAVDANGAYHVVCVSEISGVWRLRYLTNVTGTPQEQLVAAGDLGAFGSGATPAIGATPTGTVHIAYRGVSAVYRVHHVYNQTPGGSDWSWSAIITPNGEDLGKDLEVGANGEVHLAVSGDDCFGCPPRTYYVHRTNDGIWESPILIPHSPGLTNPSVALDPAGGPHVAMAEVNGNIYTGNLFYASAANGWTAVPVIGDDHAEPCLQVDASGYGHLVCMTGPNTGVEDVLYLRSSDAVVGIGDVSSVTLDILTGGPNPFVDGIDLAVDWERVPTGSAAVRLGVYDPAGRLVRSLAFGEGDRSGAPIRWDGLDEAGSAVGPGVYFVRLDGLSFQPTLKIVRVH